jgi:acetate kinase
MLQELRRLTLFDPNHLPMEIFLIEALERHFPTVPQIACFDTAFHHHLPRVAQLLPIPRCYEAKGARRYGFHGLSCSFIMEELRRVAGAEEAQGKIILAHLGNGVSLTAIHHGTSIDSSMGFTPTSGVMMGTRSGDLDPALLAFLGETEQMTAAEFHEMVSKRSGLLGVSETSSDLRDLLAIEKKDLRAAEAIALFCYQIKKTIGAFAAALHGLDSLIFTGGIGEHASSIRQRTCEGLSFLGIALDEAKNRNNELLVSKREATVKVYVLPTDEELMLAKSALSFL